MGLTLRGLKCPEINLFFVLNEVLQISFISFSVERCLNVFELQNFQENLEKETGKSSPGK